MQNYLKPCEKLQLRIMLRLGFAQKDFFTDLWTRIALSAHILIKLHCLLLLTLLKWLFRKSLIADQSSMLCFRLFICRVHLVVSIRLLCFATVVRHYCLPSETTSQSRGWWWENQLRSVTTSQSRGWWWENQLRSVVLGVFIYL